MLANTRWRFMSKEAFISPGFPAPDEGKGFAVQPDTSNFSSSSNKLQMTTVVLISYPIAR